MILRVWSFLIRHQILVIHLQRLQGQDLQPVRHKLLVRHIVLAQRLEVAIVGMTVCNLHACRRTGMCRADLSCSG